MSVFVEVSLKCSCCLSILVVRAKVMPNQQSQKFNLHTDPVIVKADLLPRILLCTGCDAHIHFTGVVECEPHIDWSNP